MPLEVLLVEDSPGDVRLVQEAFRETKSSINLHVTIDGIDALAFLRQEGDYASSPRPDFILLDLNMPRMNGRELLTIIKRDQGLSSIPVAILTASDADIDIETSYALQANCYLRKPVDLLEFQTLIGVINQFWLTMVRFPPRPGIPKAFQGFDEASRSPGERARVPGWIRLQPRRPEMISGLRVGDRATPASITRYSAAARCRRISARSERIRRRTTR